MIKLNTKKQAIRVFGSNVAMARAIGVSRQAIDQWPDRLTQRQKNEALGAAISSGKIPCQLDSVA